MSTILQGDVHRFYDRLRRRWPTPPTGAVPDLDHVRAIREYYAAIAPAERRLLLAWARKEESGIGLIPATLSAIPLIGLLFVPMMQKSLDGLSTTAWLAMWGISGLAFTAGVYIHQRQKAFTTLHVTILEELCAEPGTNR